MAQVARDFQGAGGFPFTLGVLSDADALVREVMQGVVLACHEFSVFYLELYGLILRRLLLLLD